MSAKSTDVSRMTCRARSRPLKFNSPRACKKKTAAPKRTASSKSGTTLTPMAPRKIKKAGMMPSANSLTTCSLLSLFSRENLIQSMFPFLKLKIDEFRIHIGNGFLQLQLLFHRFSDVQQLAILMMAEHFRHVELQLVPHFFHFPAGGILKMNVHLPTL